MDVHACSSIWPRKVLVWLLPVLTVLQGIAFLVCMSQAVKRVVDLDFRTIYAAAYMVRTQRGGAIYDTQSLQDVKEQAAPIKRITIGNQPMDHPAYEALLFAPLSLLSYPTAVIVFASVNLAMILLCARLLRATVFSERWTLPLLFVAGFFPILKALVLGQDSLLLLALFLGALRMLKSGKELAAGALIGLGMFKFQVAVPVGILFLLWRQWRFSAGFAVTASISAVLSLFAVGVSGARQYFSLILGMSLHLRTTADGALTSTSPNTMLNLRGLISAIFSSVLPHWWIQGTVVLASVAVLVIAGRCRPSLPLAIVAACLVSYHLNAQDAAVLLIPIAVCLSSRFILSTAIGLTCFVAPITSFSVLYGFLAAIPILGMFFVFTSRYSFAVRTQEEQYFGMNPARSS